MKLIPSCLKSTSKAHLNVLIKFNKILLTLLKIPASLCGTTRRDRFESLPVLKEVIVKRTRESSRNRFFICTLGLFVATLMLTLQPVWSQDVTAAITGNVVDPSDHAITGARVTAKDTNRGTVWTTQTNSVGSFTLSRVPIGNYEVRVEVQGFQTSIQSPVTLDLNQVARLDFRMKIGNASERVEVIAAAPVLKTETTDVSTIIDARTNDNLPLATRNPVQLTLLSPGAVTVDTASLNMGSNTAEGGGRPYINGNREQANNFLLDGVDDNQSSENRLGLTPSPDAIQEFNLITQNASAEFGNFQGGIVNTTIKSGTNSYHGNVFEFFRNDKFNANKWENGFTIGGPVDP